MEDVQITLGISLFQLTVAEISTQRMCAVALYLMGADSNRIRSYFDFYRERLEPRVDPKEDQVITKSNYQKHLGESVLGQYEG